MQFSATPSFPLHDDNTTATTTTAGSGVMQATIEEPEIYTAAINVLVSITSNSCPAACESLLSSSSSSQQNQMQTERRENSSSIAILTWSIAMLAWCAAWRCKLAESRKTRSYKDCNPPYDNNYHHHHCTGHHRTNANNNSDSTISDTPFSLTEEFIFEVNHS